tara:strand:+ start:27595 stop:29880 length:2286 start_codon:yes stop_codon:yes gene_type:complete
MADFTFSVPDEVVGVVPKLDENNQQIVEAAVDPQIDDQIETEATPVIVESEQTSSVEPTYKTIVVGHGSFEIDSKATPEQIEAARFDYINNDINFYSGLDRQSGASWSATKAVGDALKPEDKLATLRKFYPDAMPFGEDNFVFTNDETGQVTLYNAPGFTLKDIAQFTREGSVAVGSALGGVFGAGGGLVVGSPTGPGALGTAAIGGTAGAIWGGAQTASVYDFLSQAFGETVRSESIVAKTGENLLQGLYAGAGESVGRVAIPAAISSVKKALGGGTAKSQIIYDTLVANNIKPTAGTITAGRGAGRLESALDQAAASATIMRNQIDEVIDGAQAASEKLASKIGQPVSQQQQGIKMQEAAQSAIEKFTVQQSKLETELAEKIGDDTLFSIDSIRGFYDELISASASMPRFTKRAFGDAKLLLDDIILDAAGNNGRIPYSEFRRVRTLLGEKMSDMTEGSGRTMYKRMYGHMTDDLKFGADSLGFGKMFDDAVDFTKSFKQEYDDFLNKIIDYDAPEMGYRFLMNSRKDGGTYFQKLKEQFTEEEWQDVSATIIQKMGYKNFGNEADEAFSTATFLNNWKSISLEAKKTLFSETRKGDALLEELNGLIDVFSALNKNARLAGHSNSGSVAHTLNLMNALGGNAGAVILGVIGFGAGVGPAAAALATTFIGGVVTPNVSARLITNPAFVKWLATSASVKTGKQAGEHMGRLIGISQANPEIASEIDEYILAIKNGITPINEPGRIPANTTMLEPENQGAAK